MKDIIAKVWPGLSLAVIIVLAVLLLRGGCNKKPVVDSAAIEQAAKHGWDSAQAVDSPAIVSLTKKADSLNARIDTLTGDLVNAHSDLQKRGGEITQTLAAYDKAKAKGDTADFLARGDTLAREVKAGIPAVEGFAHLSDSLIAAQVALVSVKDSIIRNQARQIKLAKKTITAQDLAYQVIHKDDLHKTAQVKFYKPVAIVSTAVVSAIVLLKFIAH